MKLIHVRTVFPNSHMGMSKGPSTHESVQQRTALCSFKYGHDNFDNMACIHWIVVHTWWDRVRARKTSTWEKRGFLCSFENDFSFGALCALFWTILQDSLDAFGSPTLPGGSFNLLLWTMLETFQEPSFPLSLLLTSQKPRDPEYCTYVFERKFLEHPKST